MILPIVLFGDPVLRKVTKNIDKDYEDLDLFLDNMFDTMYGAEGVGLAAPQIGRAIRVFVVDLSPIAEDEPELENFVKVFINPVITETYGDPYSMEEGCLSVPGVRESVVRDESIKITYFDKDWVEHIEEYSGFAARAIQHEYDHLEGKMFVDYCAPLKKRFIKGKLNDISKGKTATHYRVRPPRR